MPGQAWKKQRHELWEQFRDHGTTTALAELLHHAAYLAPQPGLDAVINEFFKLAGHSEHYDAAWKRNVVSILKDFDRGWVC